MKYKIDYYWIEHDAHFLAMPTFQTYELVECETPEQLHNYIESQKDPYGGSFRKSEGKFMGYDYLSNQGGVKVSQYEQPPAPEFKNLDFF